MAIPCEDGTPRAVDVDMAVVCISRNAKTVGTSAQRGAGRESPSARPPSATPAPHASGRYPGSRVPGSLRESPEAHDAFPGL